MTRSSWRHPAVVLGSLAFIYCPHSATQQSNEPQDTPFKIEVNVHRVVVPVVVRDNHGNTVNDLKENEFHVFDDDKPRAVSGFTVEKFGAANGRTGRAAESGTQQPVSADAAAGSPSARPRFIVLLFDDLHLSIEDLGHAQKAATTVMDAALAGTDMVALVSTSGQTNSGFTRDRAKLQEALTKLRTRSVYRAEGAACPTGDCSHVTGEQIDSLLQSNPGLNPQTDRGVADGLARSANSQNQILRTQDVRATYTSIREFVGRMAALPGIRTLILVSPGFATDWPEARVEESGVIDLAAQSEVTISALDTRGLWTPFSPGAFPANGNVMAELADGTGGTFAHNSNDLDAEFRALIQPPELVYLLELPLDNMKSDGKYHRLKVKVDRDNVELQARHGYFMPKSQKSGK